MTRHPHLVYCSVSGYGLRGEERDRPTYDIGAFWARSGLAVQMADADGSPLNARGGIGDHITALAALAGLLAAVIEQRATGRGRVVEVSLLRTGAYILGWDLGLQMALGKVAGIGAAARQPGAAHEPLSGVRRPLVLLLRARGRAAPAGRLPGPRSSGAPRRPAVRHRHEHPAAPHRGHRRPG